MTDGLATHLATSFVFDEAGRIVRNADPDRGAAPRLYIGGGGTGTPACLSPHAGAGGGGVSHRQPRGSPRRRGRGGGGCDPASGRRRTRARRAGLRAAARRRLRRVAC